MENTDLSGGQEILRYGEEVEVLEPAWLRDETKAKIERLFNKYK